MFFSLHVKHIPLIAAALLVMAPPAQASDSPLPPEQLKTFQKLLTNLGIASLADIQSGKLYSKKAIVTFSGSSRKFEIPKAYILPYDHVEDTVTLPPASMLVVDFVYPGFTSAVAHMFSKNDPIDKVTEDGRRRTLTVAGRTLNFDEVSQSMKKSGVKYYPSGDQNGLKYYSTTDPLDLKSTHSSPIKIIYIGNTDSRKTVMDCSSPSVAPTSQFCISLVDKLKAQNQLNDAKKLMAAREVCGDKFPDQQEAQKIYFPKGFLCRQIFEDGKGQTYFLTMPYSDLPRWQQIQGDTIKFFSGFEITKK
ncbi:MAG: hypothetical protein RBR86_09575 [Pseudobdellovibrionaceae bacterium]|nr:hypothetical protein [Pseudobdellovibrionaceae bacterium]